ncbi:MAG: hypothetical protein AAB658_10540 [Chloroflexota bacterium]
MNKKLIVFAGLALLAISLLSLTVAGSAYAQNPTPPAPGYGPGYGPGMMGNSYGGYGHGRGMMMRGVRTSASYGPMHDAMQDALAAGLDLTREELDARIAAGETPAQIAAAQGLSSEDFAKIFAGARKAAMDKAVADGYLTQQQANRMLNRMAGRGFAGNCPMVPAQTSP